MEDTPPTTCTSSTVSVSSNDTHVTTCTLFTLSHQTCGGYTSYYMYLVHGESLDLWMIHLLLRVRCPRRVIRRVEDTPPTTSSSFTVSHQACEGFTSYYVYLVQGKCVIRRVEDTPCNLCKCVLAISSFVSHRMTYKFKKPLYIANCNLLHSPAHLLTLYLSRLPPPPLSLSLVYPPPLSHSLSLSLSLAVYPCLSLCLFIHQCPPPPIFTSV